MSVAKWQRSAVRAEHCESMCLKILTELVTCLDTRCFWHKMSNLLKHMRFCVWKDMVSKLTSYRPIWKCTFLGLLPLTCFSERGASRAIHTSGRMRWSWLGNRLQWCEVGWTGSGHVKWWPSRISNRVNLERSSKRTHQGGMKTVLYCGTWLSCTPETSPPTTSGPSCREIKPTSPSSGRTHNQSNQVENANWGRWENCVSHLFHLRIYYVDLD